MDLELNTKKCLNGLIRLSVVSHEQDDLVDQLLASIGRYCRTDRLLVSVVRNTRTPSKFTFERFPFPVTVVQNSTPKGFGANHNQIFAACQEEYFCVLNPDILLTCDPFDRLISCFGNQDVGVVAPTLVDSDGRLQDSARRYPSPGRILRRLVCGKIKDEELFLQGDPVFPDWVAGMFMLFPAAIYREIGGFDERYFMYCEDADICMRLSRRGYKTQLVSQVRAVHNARRASHRTIRHIRWHVSSLVRFFFRYPFYTL